MQERRNKTKVKKGRVAVNVGLTHDNDDENRDHRALQRAREIYGYPTTGPLMLPCSIHDFLHILRKIEKGGTKYGS
ncbi:UNVERIFIED_CONTAM: hypothetical protein Sindi_0769100 [Sesamum indicum]